MRKARVNKPRRLKLGPVVGGTQDRITVLRALLGAADSIRLVGNDWTMKCLIGGHVNSNYEAHRREGKKEGADLDADGTIAELVEEDIDEMEYILDRYVPACCYFGVFQGDYGVWPDSDVPFHGPETDEVAKGAYLPKGIKQPYFLQVNDHGNATMWRKVRCGKGYKWLMCWSMV